MERKRTDVQHMYVQVDRHIRRLDSDILKHEESLALGLRAGTLPSQDAQNAIAQSSDLGNMSSAALESLQNPSGSSGTGKGHIRTEEENTRVREEGTADLKTEDDDIAATTGGEGEEGGVLGHAVTEAEADTTVVGEEMGDVSMAGSTVRGKGGARMSGTPSAAPKSGSSGSKRKSNPRPRKSNPKPKKQQDAGGKTKSEPVLVAIDPDEVSRSSWTYSKQTARVNVKTCQLT